MDIYRHNEDALVFDTTSDDSWVRFVVVNGKLGIDSAWKPALSRSNVKLLRKWLKKNFK